jgi:hypothetical protein
MMSDKKIVWKKIYTIVLLANLLYILAFYFITQIFAS